MRWTPRTDLILAAWGDDGASRGASYRALRDLAWELELEITRERAVGRTLRGNDPKLEPYLDMIFQLVSCLSGASRHYMGLCDEAAKMLRDADYSTIRAMEDSKSS